MSELTSEEKRLRIPVGDLRGLDPRGLWLRHITGGDPRMCMHADAEDGLVWFPPYADDPDPADDWTLDLSDPATADRCARWLAGRVGVQVGCTAPRWSWSVTGAWYLDGRDHEETAHWFGPACGGTSIPSLAALDPADPRLLPDGSRWVDRAALAEVCRHVGRTP